MATTTTCLKQYVAAPRRNVYRALLHARAVAIWKVPNGMRSHVHEFSATEGGTFRVSLTYDVPNGRGKTDERTDTYCGRFLNLVPDEKVVEVMAFETADPIMQGEMRVTYSLLDAEGGTDVLAVHENVPPGIAPEDNALGWKMALEKLASYVEVSTQQCRLSPPIRLARTLGDA